MSLDIQTDLLKKKIRNQSNGEQTVELAERTIESLCTELELDDSTAQTASAIYRRSIRNKFPENRTVGGVVAASIHAASRIENDVRTVDEICVAAKGVKLDSTHRQGSTVVSRIFSEMKREFDGLKTGPVDPKEHIRTFSDELDVNEDVKLKAMELIEVAAERDFQVISGKSPSGLAAAAVYAASLLVGDDRLTQPEVSKSTGISESTIRYRYQEIIETVGNY